MGIHEQYSWPRTLSRSFAVGLFFACLWLGLAVISAAAEGEASQKNSAATSGKSSDFSTDNLKEQITNLDGQIQKLREQSLALQEQTRAKLQAQLDILKQHQDALVPRIEILRDHSERAWEDIKDNIQKTIEDLKVSIDTMDK
jgi:hypothetical protein